MKHITLLGDSIFDNKPYVGGGKDVITHLQKSVPENWKASLRAVDGSRAQDVVDQLGRIPDVTTQLFVSVGGNDALYEADVLDFKVSSSREVFSNLSDRAAAFENRYVKMLRAILDLKLPTALCTIYFPRMDDPFAQKIAVSALSAFNDVIIRQAFVSGLPLIDLRLICTEYSDYANSIEPSDAGGAKIAKVILRVSGEHDFTEKKTSVYF